MSDLDEFLFDLDHFGKVTMPEAYLEAQTLIGLNMYRELALRTPIDTGNARANWNIAEGSPDRSLREWKGGASRASNRIAREAMKFQNKKRRQITTIWLSNNVPYINRLNHGHSGKAPNGMTSGAIAAVRARADRIIFEVELKYRHRQR